MRVRGINKMREFWGPINVVASHPFMRETMTHLNVRAALIATGRNAPWWDPSGMSGDSQGSQSGESAQCVTRWYAPRRNRRWQISGLIWQE